MNLILKHLKTKLSQNPNSLMKNYLNCWTFYLFIFLKKKKLKTDFVYCIQFHVCGYRIFSALDLHARTRRENIQNDVAQPVQTLEHPKCIFQPKLPKCP